MLIANKITALNSTSGTIGLLRLSAIGYQSMPSIPSYGVRLIYVLLHHPWQEPCDIGLSINHIHIDGTILIRAMKGIAQTGNSYFLPH